MSAAADFDPFADDLLGGIPEHGATAWLPKPGEGIQGVVVDRYETKSKSKTHPFAPVVVVQASDGTNWSITGFRTTMRKEIDAKDPQIGDTFAIKYFGTETIKKGEFAGEPCHIYRSALRRGNGTVPVIATAAPAGGSPTAAKANPFA